MGRFTGMRRAVTPTSFEERVIRNRENSSVMIQPGFFFFFSCFPKKQQSHNGLHKTTSSAGTWRSLEGKEHQSYCTVSAALKRNVQPEILRRSQEGHDVLCERREEAYFISLSKFAGGSNGLDCCSWVSKMRKWGDSLLLSYPSAFMATKMMGGLEPPCCEDRQREFVFWSLEKTPERP